MQEEVQLLNSYAGPKAHKIGNILCLQSGQHFYAKPTGVHESERLQIAQSGTLKNSALRSLQPNMTIRDETKISKISTKPYNKI